MDAATGGSEPEFADNEDTIIAVPREILDEVLDQILDEILDGDTILRLP